MYILLDEHTVCERKGIQKRKKAYLRLVDSKNGHSHVGFTVQGMARKNITTIQRRGKIKQEYISEIVMW